jgi:hypothetical protein
LFGCDRPASWPARAPLLRSSISESSGTDHDPSH